MNHAPALHEWSIPSMRRIMPPMLLPSSLNPFTIEVENFIQPWIVA